MTRALMIAAALALGTAAPALACSTAEEATRTYDRALAAYFAAAPQLSPEDHTRWTEALRGYQTARDQGNFPRACEALNAGATAIGLTA